MFVLVELVNAVIPQAEAPAIVYGLLTTLSTVVLSVCYWVTRTTLAVSRTVDKIVVAMYGFNGDNGINGDVKACRKALDDHVKEHHRRRGDNHQDRSDDQ